jgi:hypothetical protein
MNIRDWPVTAFWKFLVLALMLLGSQWAAISWMMAHVAPTASNRDPRH